MDTETTALILTFIYMIANREALFRAPSITILYDSTSAINTASGLWKSKNTRQITTIAQGLYESIQQIFDIDFHHVSSHTGHPMNPTHFEKGVLVVHNQGRH